LYKNFTFAVKVIALINYRGTILKFTDIKSIAKEMLLTN